MAQQEYLDFVDGLEGVLACSQGGVPGGLKCDPSGDDGFIQVLDLHT